MPTPGELSFVNFPVILRRRKLSHRVRLIDFEEVKPRGTTLRWFWHGMGADRLGRIYVAIGNGEERSGGPGDVLLFRYDPADHSKQLLGSVREILDAEANLGPNALWEGIEGVAKVHCDIIEHRDRIYFATHDFHTGDDMAAHRGGHFIEYNPGTGKFSDLSKNLPGGVAVSNQGIIATAILRKTNTLVGWTYPKGQVLLYDLDNGTNAVFSRSDDTHSQPDVARVVLVTEDEEIYVAYTGKSAPKCLYRLDRELEALMPTDQRFRKGFFEGLAHSSRWNCVFLADTDGELYRFELSTRRLLPLGSILPRWRRSLGATVKKLRNLTLSPNQNALFTIPRDTAWGGGAYHLYQYHIATRSTTDVGFLGETIVGAMPTGNGVWDNRGGFYLSCYFGSDHEMCVEPGRHSGLLRVDVSDLNVN